MARSRKRAPGGFPPAVLALFLGMTIMLGVLLSWALGLSVQVDSQSASTVKESSFAPGTDDSGLPVLTHTAIGAETQKLIDTGTLQNPASFNVTACLESLGASTSVLMLEEVSWEGASRAWLIIHDDENLTQVRAHGGEVSAAIVRSTCGADPEADPDVLWTGTVLVDAQS